MGIFGNIFNCYSEESVNEDIAQEIVDALKKMSDKAC